MIRQTITTLCLLLTLSPLAFAETTNTAPLLSAEDQKILEHGEITQGRYITGGILGTWPGFGIGHAVQGRYMDKGWMFTAGEIGSIAMIGAGLNNNCTWTEYSEDSYKCDNNDTLVWLGIMGLFGFRIWEIVDVWSAPREHNRRYLELKARTQARRFEFKPIVVPKDDGAMVVGMFSF